MRQTYLLLMLTLFATCVKCAALTEDTTTGWLGESQVNTDRTASNGGSIYRKLEGRITAVMEDGTNNANNEESISLKSIFRKKPVAPKTLQKRPTVAKIVQDSPDIAKVIKSNPGIGQTAGKMQKDRTLIKEVQSSPVFSKLQSSLRKTPFKKNTVADVKNMGVATAKSMKSTEKWHDNPAPKVLALGLFVAVMLVVGVVGIASAISPQDK